MPRQLIVARVGGKLAGFGALVDRGPADVELVGPRVRLRYRGRGVGIALAAKVRTDLSAGKGV